MDRAKGGATSLRSDGIYDAVVVGGGPAGASCALWLHLLGLRPCIVERTARLGGLQNHSPYDNHWIVSTPGLSGQSIAALIHGNIEHHGIEARLGRRS